MLFVKRLEFLKGKNPKEYQPLQCHKKAVGKKKINPPTTEGGLEGQGVFPHSSVMATLRSREPASTHFISQPSHAVSDVALRASVTVAAEQVL